MCVLTRNRVYSLKRLVLWCFGLILTRFTVCGSHIEVKTVNNFFFAGPIFKNYDTYVYSYNSPTNGAVTGVLSDSCRPTGQLRLSYTPPSGFFELAMFPMF